jgi:hypothetical protein
MTVLLLMVRFSADGHTGEVGAESRPGGSSKKADISGKT